MNETDNTNAEAPSVRVNDRRRFDPDGNVRPEGEGLSASPVEQEGPVAAPQTEDESPLAQELKGTQELLNAARKRVDELARAYQALVQDREEFKQRLSREREQLMNVEKGNVAQVLLDVIDELELSIQASANDNSPLAQGVRLIRDGLLQKLQGLGVERLTVTNQPYNPNTAEAADMEITADPEQDQWVVGELRGGYRLKDRIIRPARVKVAKYIKPAEA